MHRPLAPSFLLAIVLTGRAAAAPFEVTTGKVEADCAWTPLEFALPEPASAARLVSAAGESIPCQVASAGGKSRLTWVAREIPKGEERRWKVELMKEGTGAAGVEVKKAGDGAVSVLAGGKEIARLASGRDGKKPYLFPLIGPGGVLMTRQFPMRSGVEGEKQDHPHHRSLWFTHGSVQGVDFWSEGGKTGAVRQAEVERTESGPVFGMIAVRNEWIAPGGARLSDGRTAPAEGEKLLVERTAFTLYPLERGALLLDVAVSLSPAAGPVVFGDTKEGTFGIRLAESMKETRGGRIVNSRGKHGMKETWGKPAEWVDYFGPVGGATVGVAILDHPESFRHPTHWHVRDYGLFAANPFGYDDFGEEKKGDHTLEPGKTMEFRYRVYFHHGDAEAARVAQVYEGFAHPPAVRRAEQP